MTQSEIRTNIMILSLQLEYIQDRLAMAEDKVRELSMERNILCNKLASLRKLPLGEEYRGSWVNRLRRES